MSKRRVNGSVRTLPFERAVSATLVTEAQIRPDGSVVAFSTTMASKAAEHSTGAIWLIDTVGGTPRRVTGGAAFDRHPRWSRDGTMLAFLSDRLTHRTFQLYILTIAGGDGVRITDTKGGVSAFEWSPDGSTIAFIARDPESDEARRRRDEREDWIVRDPKGDADERRSALYVITLPDDPTKRHGEELPEARRVSPERMHVGGYVDAGFSWAPDSQALVAMVGPSARTDDRIRSHMYVFGLDGVVTNLGVFEGLTFSPRFNHDGSQLAFIGAEDEIPARWVLQTMSATGGSPTVVAPGFEGAFQAFAWLPDGDRLLTSVETFQHSRFLNADLETGTLDSAWQTPQVRGTIASTPSTTADGTTWAYVWEDEASFGDVWLAEAGGNARRLTNLNPWVADYDFGELRDIAWTSFDGMEIQGLLLLPVGYEPGKQYPMLTHIHGGPAGAWTHHLYASWHDWGQFMAQRGYVVLMPNPCGSTGRGVEFLRGIIDTYGEPDWQDIMSGVDYLIEQDIAYPDQLVVGGWSGGGFLTNTTVTCTNRFKAAVSGAGIANWVSFQGTADIRSVFARYVGAIEDDPEIAWQLSPIRNIRNATTPTLILCGSGDDRVDASQSYEMYEGLKANGVETQLVVYPREPHSILERNHQIDVLERVVAWFDRHLGRTA